MAALLWVPEERGMWEWVLSNNKMWRARAEFTERFLRERKPLQPQCWRPWRKT